MISTFLSQLSCNNVKKTRFPFKTRFLMLFKIGILQNLMETLEFFVELLELPQKVPETLVDKNSKVSKIIVEVFWQVYRKIEVSKQQLSQAL